MCIEQRSVADGVNAPKVDYSSILVPLFSK